MSITCLQPPPSPSSVTQYPVLRHRLGGSLDGLWALAGGAQRGPDGEPPSMAKRLAGLIVWLAAGKAAELLLTLPWKIRCGRGEEGAEIYWSTDTMRVLCCSAFFEAQRALLSTVVSFAKYVA